MNLVVVHIFLLLIDFAQRVEPLGLPHRKLLFTWQLGVNGFQVTLEIVELLAYTFSGFFAVRLQLRLYFR